MRSASVSFVASVAVLLVSVSTARCQSLVVQKDWSLLTSVSSSGPTHYDGETFCYQTAIPWRVDWNSSPSPWPVPGVVRAFRDGASTGEVLDQTYVPGNSSGTNTYGTATGMSNSILLDVLAFHPQYYPIPLIVVAQASDSSGTEEAEFNTGDLTADIPFSPASIEDLFGNAGLAAATTYFFSSITSTAQQEAMSQFGLTQQQVEALAALYKSWLENNWEDLSAASAGTLLDALHPTHVLRMGEGNPVRAVLEDVWDTIPAAMAEGASGHSIGDFVTIQYNSTGLSERIKSGFMQLAATQQPPDPEQLFADLVIIDRVEFSFPVELQFQSFSIAGHFRGGTEGISFSRPAGSLVYGELSVQFSAFGGQGVLGAGFSRSYNATEEDWNPPAAGASFQFSY